MVFERLEFGRFGSWQMNKKLKSPTSSSNRRSMWHNLVMFNSWTRWSERPFPTRVILCSELLSIVTPGSKHKGTPVRLVSRCGCGSRAVLFCCSAQGKLSWCAALQDPGWWCLEDSRFWRKSGSLCWRWLRCPGLRLVERTLCICVGSWYALAISTRAFRRQKRADHWRLM